MKKKKYYVVWKGRSPGIYETWSACELQVKGYPGAKYKSFTSKHEAEAEFAKGYSPSKKQVQTAQTDKVTAPYIKNSLSVDAGTHGNPGPVEYQGVLTHDGTKVFQKEAYPLGTNNMAEFLAIVHAFQYLKENDLNIPVYSDSKTAIGWVKAKKAKATLIVNEKSTPIWQDVQKAEQWLRENDQPYRLLKWETKAWGEIKADYGRK